MFPESCIENIMDETSDKPPALLVFLKLPVAGAVKTRLAKHVGDAKACAIYRTLVSRQLEQLPQGWPVRIYYTGQGGEAQVRAWIHQDDFHYVPQINGDLGARLHCAFEETFQAGYSSAIAIGGDCPYLTADTIRGAALRMQEADVIFGPALDGGYYLIGMKQLFCECFDAIPWGQDDVLNVSLGKLKDSGVSMKLLEKLEDVDDVASWERACKVLGIAGESDYSCGQ